MKCTKCEEARRKRAEKRQKLQANSQEILNRSRRVLQAAALAGSMVVVGCASPSLVPLDKGAAVQVDLAAPAGGYWNAWRTHPWSMAGGHIVAIGVGYAVHEATDSGSGGDRRDGDGDQVSTRRDTISPIIRGDGNTVTIHATPTITTFGGHE